MSNCLSERFCLLVWGLTYRLGVCPSCFDWGGRYFSCYHTDPRMRRREKRPGLRDGLGRFRDDTICREGREEHHRKREGLKVDGGSLRILLITRVWLMGYMWEVGGR